MSHEIKQFGSLQLDEESQLERRSLSIHVVGWAVIGVFLLLAAGGLFGGGGTIASRTVTTDDGGLHMEYDRVVRRGTEIELRLRLLESAPIAIPSGYFDFARVRSIVPEPRASRSTGEAVEFYFADCGPCEFRFHLEMGNRSGEFRGEICAGARSVELRQVILP